MHHPHHYEVLGLKLEATAEQIEQAYHQAKQHAQSPDALQRIEQAYQTLGNADARAQYDEAMAPHFNPADFYPIEDLTHIEDADQDEEEEPKPKTLKAKILNVLKVIAIVCVTVGLLYYVFSKVPISKIKDRLVNADKLWLLAAIGSYLVSMFFASWRLLSFFKSIELRLNRKFNLRLYFLGLCYNLFLPGGIGGDGYKIYLLHKRYKMPTKKVFWAIFLDRLSGLWAIGMWVTTLAILIPEIQIHNGLLVGIFALGTVIYYMVALKFFKKYTRYFVKAHLKAIGVQFFQVLTIFCLLMGQSHIGKFAPYLLSFLVSSLAAILPSIGGGGVRELIFDSLSKPLHLAEDLALYLSFTFYLISIVVAAYGAYYVFRTDKLEEGLPKIEDQEE